MRILKRLLIVLVLMSAGFWAYKYVIFYLYENAVLKQIVARLEADSRIAEVLVTDAHRDESQNKVLTTIKFLEYDHAGLPLEPKYFTFTGNIIQFQSLVIRFDDIFVRGGDRLKGKSAYLFWKVFMLDGANTQEFEISKPYEIPSGYKLRGVENPAEEILWKKFWDYALDQALAHKSGIKNAQIEAPGTMFLPGYLYTIRIEHDGGMRIDAQMIPDILRGEKIP